MAISRRGRKWPSAPTAAATVPQIFFGDTHVGGCDDLYELHYDGKLDLLLADLAR